MRRSHFKRRISICLAVASLASVGLSASHVLAENERDSIFSRIDAAEVRSSTHRENAARLVVRLKKADAELDRLATQQETVRRASRPVRRRLGVVVTQWDRTLRANKRVRGWGPGSDRDTEILLLRAAKQAIPQQMNDVEVLDRLSNDRSAYDDLLGQRMRMTVELAQDAATSDAAEAERDAELEGAKDDPNVRDDLEATSETLHTSMSRFLKNSSKRDFHRQKGTLVRPVPGPPTYAFGPRPTTTAAATVRHTGHTWRVDAGTSVRATASGLVVYAQSFEGYGKLVMVDHGAGYHSLYAHLSEIGVKQGDTVRRGETIGASGDTASLDGPKLYFELRKDGDPIDPSPWFLQMK